MNKIFLHGRLARDPKVGETTQGVKYARFTVACDRSYSDGGQKTTDFIDCSAWRQGAELVEKHFTKGSGIIVEGSMRVSSYTDQAGQKRTSYEVYVDRVEFPSGAKREAAAGGNNAPAETPAAEAAAVGAEDGADPWADC